MQLSDRPTLPVFVYECSSSSMSDIRSSEPSYENIFQDFTETLNESLTSPAPDKKDSVARTVDTFGKSFELLAYCNAVYERYFQVFVSGVFTSLQLTHALKNTDVESSVELICEESYLEIDMTNLIRILCTHYRNEKVEDEVFKQDNLSQVKVSVRKGKPSMSASSPRTCRSSSTARKSCGDHPRHTFVQNKFSEILENRFSSVPDSTNFFFYKANRNQVSFSIFTISTSLRCLCISAHSLCLLLFKL